MGYRVLPHPHGAEAKEAASRALGDHRFTIINIAGGWISRL
jgi:hypothetical protein